MVCVVTDACDIAFLWISEVNIRRLSDEGIILLFISFFKVPKYHHPLSEEQNHF